MKDRVPTKVLPNGAIRFGEYDESGNLLGYKYIRREDEPTEVGTPQNKTTLMPDALATALGLNPATATVAEGIGAAQKTVPIGGIMSSIRTDFMQDVSAGKYLSCSGQILNVALYPELGQVAPSILGNFAVQNASYGSNAAWTMIETDTGRLIVATNSNNIKYSDDEGTTWQTVATPMTSNKWIFKAHSNRLFCAGYKSDDNGITWTQIGGVAGYARFKANNNVLIGIFQSGIDWLYRSTDNGDTWSQVTLPTSRDWNRWLVTDTGRIILVSNNSSPDWIVSDDNGATWSFLSQTILSNYSPNTLANVGGNKLLISASSGYTYKTIQSTDNGNSWSQLGTFGFYNESKMFLKDNLLYGLLMGGRPLVSFKDAGAGTQATNTGSFVTDADNMFLTSTGKIFVLKVVTSGTGSPGVWEAKKSITLPSIANFYVRVK